MNLNFKFIEKEELDYYMYAPPNTWSKEKPGLNDLYSAKFLNKITLFPFLATISLVSVHAKSEQFPTHELLYTPEVDITNSLSETIAKCLPFGENLIAFIY